MTAMAARLSVALNGLYRDGLGLACVAGISAAEAMRRLAATPTTMAETDPFDDSPFRYTDGDMDVVGATDVPGGCVITQPWGYAPQRPEAMVPLSAGTVAYGLYANPKSGNQGCIFRDGATEGWDLHPGGHPYPDSTSREILVGYLTQGNAIAYCCAFAGLDLPDTRAIEGPPDIWLRLPN